MRRAVKRVWFLACPGTGLLNIANPWEVLGHTNDVLGRAAYELQLFGPGGPLLIEQSGGIGAGFGLLVAKNEHPETASDATNATARFKLAPSLE